MISLVGLGFSLTATLMLCYRSLIFAHPDSDTLTIALTAKSIIETNLRKSILLSVAVNLPVDCSLLK